MEPLAFVAATLLVLGAPAASAVYWLRSRDVTADSVELVAVAYGGIAVSALSIWTLARAFGLSWNGLLSGVLVGSAVVVTPALIRAALRAAGSNALGAGDAIAFTGHRDGRMVPDAAAITGLRRPTPEAPPKNQDFAILAIAGLTFAGLAYIPFLTYGWERADGIHRMAMTDWYKHLITTTSLSAADAFPPPNPFLHAVDPGPYYYGFHLVAAAIARVAGAMGGPATTGEIVFPALLLLTLLTAVSTPFVAYTAARTIAAGKGGELADVSSVPLLAALGATFLAGFDLIPLTLDTLVNLVTSERLEGGLAGIRALVPSTHLDYWIHHNERQFNAPYLTTIWAPQHMAAVLVALLVIHLVLRRSRLAERTWRSAPVGVAWLLPGALLAGLPALSAYVAVGLAFGVVGATLVESVRTRSMLWHTAAWRVWFAPGAIAVVFSLPVLVVLAAAQGTGFIVEVSAAGSWANGAVFSAVFGGGALTNIADSPMVYLVEFGALGLLAVLEIGRQAAKGRLQPHHQHVVAMVVAIVALVTFVRPPMDGPNNLYARPLVLVWFLLAPFAAMRFARTCGFVVRAGGIGNRDHATPSRGRRSPEGGGRRWIVAAVLVCLLASTYALVGVALEGAMFWSTLPSTVEVARWINHNAPPSAVVAISPAELSSGRVGYWLRRPLAIADERHAVLFGATAEEFERASTNLLRVFSSSDPAAAAAGFDAAGADYVMIEASSSAARGWIDSPCFGVAYQHDAWVVLARSAECNAAR